MEKTDEGAVMDAEKTKAEGKPDVFTEAAYCETRLNGTAIKWLYWAIQMPALSAAQAACLMSALDPDKFTTLSERPGKDSPQINIDKARKIQRLAEVQGMLSASPADWLTWAEEHGIRVHDGFRMAASEIPKKPASVAKSKNGREVPKETPAERQARLKNVCDERRAAGTRAWKRQTANEEGISTSMLDRILRRSMTPADPKPGTIDALKGIKGK
jgi:hypothetical protein